MLVDRRPSLSSLTLNGLCAAHGVVVPMQCEYLRSKACPTWSNTIKQVHANLNPDLQIIGLLRVISSTAHHAAAAGQRAAQGAPRRQGFRFGDSAQRAPAEAPSYGLPGVVFDPALRGAQAFIEFAGDGAAHQNHALIDRHAHEPGHRAQLRSLSAVAVEDARPECQPPPQQRWVTAGCYAFAGKAKRSRCVNAVAPGMPVAHKLALCEPVFTQAGLPLIVRITPSANRRPDSTLDALGLGLRRPA